MLPTIDEMSVLAGMPVPVRACPVDNPVTFHTSVRVALPEVVMAVNETGVRVAVAGCDIVIEYGYTVPHDVMVAPEGMPTPVRGCPATNPVKTVVPDAPTPHAFVIVLLPMVVTPEIVIGGRVAVAFFDIVIE